MILIDAQAYHWNMERLFGADAPTNDPAWRVEPLSWETYERAVKYHRGPYDQSHAEDALRWVHGHLFMQTGDNPPKMLPREFALLGIKKSQYPGSGFREETKKLRMHIETHELQELTKLDDYLIESYLQTAVSREHINELLSLTDAEDVRDMAARVADEVEHYIGDIGQAEHRKAVLSESLLHRHLLMRTLREMEQPGCMKHIMQSTGRTSPEIVTWMTQYVSQRINHIPEEIHFSKAEHMDPEEEKTLRDCFESLIQQTPNQIIDIDNQRKARSRDRTLSGLIGATMMLNSLSHSQGEVNLQPSLPTGDPVKKHAVMPDTLKPERFMMRKIEPGEKPKPSSSSTRKPDIGLC